HIIRRNAPTTRSIIDDFFAEPFFAIAPMRQAMNDASGLSQLAVDVSENDQEVIVRADVPGFDKESIAVEVHEGVLSIRAQRSEESEQKEGEKFYRKERRAMSFERSVTLPVAVQEDKAQAALKDGVLTLTLPKNQKVLPRKIAVN
ncbi:MAG TPA: Hsp20/alpha crystallin family protein, partial [Phycisphaerales bacterium]|nr:Hsp20/alpha crystallin family protein [Phycisphaerales bacterium]